MKIKLINHTVNPEETIIKAIRTCYNSFAKQDKITDKKLLKHITKNNESPLEFVDFTFFIEDISRACSHQLVRHRMANFAQKSQRYVSEDNFEYVVPPLIKNRDLAFTEYKICMIKIKKIYTDLIKMGIRKEDARFILPNACTTTITCKFNVRSLRNFLKLRLNKKAQWEIRNVAKEMRKLVNNVAPILVEDLF